MEKKPSDIATNNVQDLEEFFDMISVANSNRFDDQRSPAPKILQPKGPIWRAPSDEIRDQVTPYAPKDEFGLKLDHLPPSVAMSMPDLHFGHPSGVRVQPKGTQSYDRAPPLQLPLQRQSGAGAPLDSPVSGPLQQHIVHNTQTRARDSWWSKGASPSRSHQDSSLVTTSHVCKRTNQNTPSEHGRVDSNDQRKEPVLNQPHSPMKTMDRGCKEERGEVLVQDRDSPDGKLPSDISVRDAGLPQRTYPDGAAVRRHQSVKSAPSDPVHSYKMPYYYYGGMRVGGTNSLGRRDSQKVQGRRVSTPTLTQVSNRPLGSRRVLSETDRSQSVEEISPTDEARSSHILFDAGLGFLSPQSPIVKGVSVSSRRDSFSGGRPKLSSWSKHHKSIIQEHCEM